MTSPSSTPSGTTSISGSTSTTTTSTAAPMGRWRLPLGETVTITGSEIGSTAQEVDCTVRELYRVTAAADTPIRVGVMVQRRDPNSAAFQMWVTRQEFDRVVGLGTQVADLHPDQVTTGMYAPVSGSAFNTGGPRFQDVRQGAMGSCRCASAFQALAVAPKGPAYLQGIIVAQEGGWVVSLRSGTPSSTGSGTAKTVPVAVDKCLPVDWKTGLLLYQLRGGKITDSGAALWPALAEKAIAQLWGGYARLEDLVKASVDESMIFSALGINVWRKHSLVGYRSDETEQQKIGRLKKFLTDAWARGCAITAAGVGKSHNYAVVKVTETGIVLVDPYTVWDEEADKRLEKPAECGDSYVGFTDPKKWPLFFTWEVAVGRFKWFWAFDVAVPGTSDGKGKEQGT